MHLACVLFCRSFVAEGDKYTKPLTVRLGPARGPQSPGPHCAVRQ